MKNFMQVLLATFGVMTLVFAGCSSADEEMTEETTEEEVMMEEEVEMVEEEEAAVEEEAVVEEGEETAE